MPLKKKGSRKKTVPRKKTVVKRKKVTVKKRIIKKPIKRKPSKKPAVAKKSEGLVVGTVTHYFPKVRAAVVKMKRPLSIGDKIKVKGHTTDFTQNITSLQIDRVPIETAKKGQEIGLLVDSRVRQRDVVYKV